MVAGRVSAPVYLFHAIHIFYLATQFDYHYYHARLMEAAQSLYGVLPVGGLHRELDGVHQ